MSIIVPELDDIGYREFREESEARLPKDAPRWSEHNLSDPGITFLEMLSWLSDIELYRLNRITPKHLQKFLALLGDHYPSARASKGMIVSTEGVSSDIKIDVGTAIEMEINQRKRVFRTKNRFCGNPAKIDRIDVFRESELFISRRVDSGEIEPFYAFGEEPKEENFFRLILNGIPSKDLNLYIELDESNLPSYNQEWRDDYLWLQEHDSIKLEWYITIDDVTYWIEPKEDKSLNLRYSGMVSFTIDKPISSSAKVLIICRLKNSSYMIAPFIKNIYLNSIEIEQSEAIVERITSSGEANQELTLGHESLLDAKGSGVAIEVESGGKIESWRRVDTLQNSKEEDRDFIYDNTTQKVLFGDGQRGSIAPYGDTIICKYLITRGESGVVANRADSWTIKGFEALNFYNPRGINGAESIPSYERRFATIIERWKTPTQAVTLEDYETLAKMTAGLRVARVKAFVDKQKKNCVAVVVVPYSRGDYPMPDDFFCRRVCRFLDSRRLITTVIDVIKPIYTEVGITLHIKIHAHFDMGRVRRDSVEAIDEYLHPLRGGDDKSGWEFGRGVYVSDIYALVESIEGISCIFDISFHGEGTYDNRKKVYTIEKKSLIRSLVHRVTFEKSSLACGGAL
ncbi:hypothetical protein GSY74_08775 [Sulfurovum sp. bin170]|uniref:baseplate J/gp47 family protein n=1 Tax=Sulfurovum sp. bin170 TaxID=2695268 RepID=UPI0013DFCBF1|nr:baseplate J/gp47 family protein [Sulfurovum sp. bin170]NEW61374.1 hypothetical protein [Sulfurovum sp. bin170]